MFWTQELLSIILLIDIDGLNGSLRGGQFLSDYRRLERAQLSRSEPSPEAEAGGKLSRRVLTCCWASMMTVLAAGLNPTKDDNAKGLLNREGDRRCTKDTVVLALEGLHRAATLSNVLGELIPVFMYIDFAICSLTFIVVVDLVDIAINCN